MRLSACVVLLLAVVVVGAECARILAMLPYNARSHFIVMEPLLTALHERGHELTVVSSFPRRTKTPGYRDIDLSDILPSVVSNYTVDSIQKNMPNLFRSVSFIIQLHMRVCEKVLADPRVVALTSETFDLMIGEMFGSDCFNYIAHKLNIPIVSWVTSTALPWVAERTGLPDNPAYIPNYFVDYGENMWFWEKLWNTLTLLYAKTTYYVESELPSRQLAERVFAKPLPPLHEVNKQTSMVLINSYFSLAQSRPLTPNVVEVGGIHIKETNTLPADLEEVLERAGPRGVVVVSFGSLVRVSSLPPATLQALLRGLARINRQVIMKFEDDLPDAPTNVVIRKWLPQADLVSDERVFALVTHCGLASTIEAVHFAKPIVAVPFFSDQYQNARQVVRRGGGVILDLDALTSDSVYHALNKILTDSSYTENMERMSRRFRDRPHSPLETAVFWTEYVIRHSGAPQLRPASLNLPLYQYLLLDVFMFKLLLAAVLLAICWFSLPPAARLSCLLCCCLFGRLSRCILGKNTIPRKQLKRKRE